MNDHVHEEEGMKEKSGTEKDMKKVNQGKIPMRMYTVISMEPT